MRVIDITLPLQSTLPPWPGDQRFARHTAYKRDTGAATNVTRIESSVHFGSHADAPFHFDDAGPTIDQIDPARYCGPAQVVDVTGHAELTPRVLAGVDLRAAPRLLLKTSCWRDLETFPADYPPMTVELVILLVQSGITLVGLDTPSVDRFGSRDIPVHDALGRADILILENLDLRPAAPGLYELFALPLKIVGSDGAPVRAVLVER